MEHAVEPFPPGPGRGEAGPHPDLHRALEPSLAAGGAGSPRRKHLPLRELPGSCFLKFRERMWCSWAGDSGSPTLPPGTPPQAQLAQGEGLDGQARGGCLL